MANFDEDADIDRLWCKLDTSLWEISQAGTRLKVDFIKDVKITIQNLKRQLHLSEATTAALLDILDQVKALNHTCTDATTEARKACSVCLATNFLDAQRHIDPSEST